MVCKPVNTSSVAPVRRVGIDLSILDRITTGTSVYAHHLFQALRALEPEGLEFIALRAPRPLPRKNILTKFGNFGIEVTWLTVLLPLVAHRLKLDLFHSPANAVSPTLRIPQVCTIHDAHFITNPQGRDPLWRLYADRTFRYAASHASRIICDTNSSKAEIVRLLGANPVNIDVIPLGLPHRKASPEDYMIASRLKPYILSVGATEPNKNLGNLVKAYVNICKKDQHLGHKLVLAGPPGRDQGLLESIANREKINDQVIFLGHVSDSLLAALYENASLFVYPSLCEGFGFPPLEAMSFGLPVAASRAPCIPEILGEAALYFNPVNVPDIAAKMQELLTSAKLRHKLIQDGLERSSKFTWEKTALKTMRVYRALLVANRSQPTNLDACDV